LQFESSNPLDATIGGGLAGKAQCPAGRVFQYRVGSGRVLDKIPGIGSGSGRVGVSKYAIGYFRVSVLLSGIFGYFGYFGYFRVFRVSTGINGYQRVFTGILYIISFLVVVSKILRFDGSSGNLEGIYVDM